MARLGPRARTGTPADFLIVGLANPGEKFADTRHNVGADVIGVLADRHGGRMKNSKESATVAETRVDGQLVVLAVPLTFYNNAGDAVHALVRRHGPLDLDRIVIVHDELDLPPGRFKIKLGGGLAGNNGLKSVKASLGSDAFARVRIGVGKPPGSQTGADHVLRRPGKAERIELDVVVQECADAIEMIVAEGLEAAMGKYNRASA